MTSDPIPPSAPPNRLNRLSRSDDAFDRSTPPARSPVASPSSRPRRLAPLLHLLLAAGCLSLPASAASVPGLPVLTRVRSWTLQDGLPDIRIKSIVRTRTGDLWFGTRDGLVRFHDAGVSVYNITNAPALRNSEVSRIVEDSRGGLWFGTPSGVVHWREERFERFDPSELPDFSINAILPESRSGLWIGGGYMLARYHEGTWTRHTRETGLRDADINSLAEDPDGRIWAGCHRGLMIFDPTGDAWRPIDMPGPFENYHVQAITFAGDGAAWILTRATGEPSCRLWRLSDTGWEERTRQDNRIGDRHLVAAFAQPAEFWDISAEWGLERWIDPSSQELVGQPPSFRDPLWSLCDDGHGNLWVGTQSDGLELWRVAGNSAAIPFAAVGTRPPPGPLAPHDQNLFWTLGLATLGLAGIGAAFHRLRVAHLKAEANRSVSDERERIASRLHDQIGSQLTELSLLARRPDANGAQEPFLGDHEHDFSRSARDLSKALRDTLWNIHPADATVDGLLNHLGDHAHAFLQAAGIRCRLAFPSDRLATELNAHFRQEIFLAFKEALHNVVRHAAATEVRLRASLQDGHFVIEIQDNGVGFAFGTPRGDSNGRGLPGMQRRLRSLGGICQINSPPGGGTCVRLELPRTSLDLHHPPGPSPVRRERVAEQSDAG